MSDMNGWNCPCCGEGYPSRQNAIGQDLIVVLRGEREIAEVVEALRAAGKENAADEVEARRDEK